MIFFVTSQLYNLTKRKDPEFSTNTITETPKCPFNFKDMDFTLSVSLWSRKERRNVDIPPEFGEMIGYTINIQDTNVT